MSTDNEFTIRVTGAVPPPLPKGKKKAAASQKCTSQQQQQQRRYNMRLCPSTSINQLRKDVYALFNIPTDHIQSYQVKQQYMSSVYVQTKLLQLDLHWLMVAIIILLQQITKRLHLQEDKSVHRQWQQLHPSRM